MRDEALAQVRILMDTWPELDLTEEEKLATAWLLGWEHARMEPVAVRVSLSMDEIVRSVRDIRPGDNLR